MRLRPYLILALLWLLYFHPLVLHPTHTLYAPYSDFLAEHLPAKLFLNREWRGTGELPLWNPYHFCGSPFVHDMQVGMFYPPNAVVYLVPERAVGAAASWVIALHLLAGGVFAFLYARAHQLNEAGSLVAAVGYMLSSKWMTHMLLAGHTITIGLAWLPLVLLGLERGIATRRAWPVVGAGVAYGLLVLGTHPQWFFFAGLLAAAWVVPADRKLLARWAVCGAVAITLAVAIAAVQLLPTWEAGQWSARRAGVEASNTLVIGPRTALALIGPSYSYSPPQSWELRGVFGLFWLSAATAAPLVAGGRARWQFGVLLGLIVFAIGGAALVEWLPGFNLFRVPTRMLVYTALPIAFLAGVTTDALTRREWSKEERAALAKGFQRVAIVAGVPTAIGLLSATGPVWHAFVAYWLAVLLALPLFAWIARSESLSARTRTAVWLGILLVDLVAPIATFSSVRPQAELYPSSPAIEYLASQPPERTRVLDWDTGEPNERASFLGIGAPQSMVHGVSTPRGYNPLDVRHYREFLAFVVNDPSPVRGNSPYTQQVIPNFEIGNPRLFRLLGVTHRIIPPDAPAMPGEWKAKLTDPAPTAPPPLMPDSPHTLPPHTLTEAAEPQPRAWIVPRAARIPNGQELLALKDCDFARYVLLSSDSALPQSFGNRPGTARITEYRPNRVVVELDGAGGWLVMGDTWFPGWTCRVDGAEVPVLRANHAFRAVPVPAGSKQAEFRFQPRSYFVGWWVSVCTALGVGVLAVWKVGVAVRRKRD